MINNSEILEFIDRYYDKNPELFRILIIHSSKVAEKALEIQSKKNLDLKREDIYIASMLHDIGIIKCNAPAIYCFGDHPYLQHGIEGKKMLVSSKFNQFANICETHVGAGITASDIQSNNLPLPPRDMVPVTLLEKLICYSDNYYSKSRDLTREKTTEEVINQVKKYGEGSLERFMEMHSLFSIY